MLLGRLGLETARVPHVDRHGLLWLSRGNLLVVDGTLHFLAAGSPEFDGGDYAIPYQMVSFILLGPGTTVSHDVFRLLARHGTALVAVGEDGVRLYSAPPHGPGDSGYARKQARLWAKTETRIMVVRWMYGKRLGIDSMSRDLSVLRGIEGSRMKETYELLAGKYGIPWHGRRYDRSNPEAADLPNQAINHAATAMEAAATVAVAATGTLPQLGFIHEDSSNSFCLDIADLFRDKITIPAAFEAVRMVQRDPRETLERYVRRLVGRRLREGKVVPEMIDLIKEMLNADDSRSNA